MTQPSPHAPAAPPTRRAVLTASAAAAASGLALTACGADGSRGGAGDSGGGEGPAPGQRVAALDDVAVGDSRAVTTPNGEEALLYRPDEETVVGFSAICTHQGCAVHAQGAELHCPCHQSVFDAATGEVLSGPADAPLPPIPVRITGGEIVTAE